MKTQHEISKELGYSQTTINFILNGKRPISWPLAERLSKMFPEKGIREWKNSNIQDIRTALNQETLNTGEGCR